VFLLVGLQVARAEAPVIMTVPYPVEVDYE